MQQLWRSLFFTKESLLHNNSTRRRLANHCSSPAITNRIYFFVKMDGPTKESAKTTANESHIDSGEVSELPASRGAVKVSEPQSNQEVDMAESTEAASPTDEATMANGSHPLDPHVGSGEAKRQVSHDAAKISEPQTIEKEVRIVESSGAARLPCEAPVASESIGSGEASEQRARREVENASEQPVVGKEILASEQSSTEQETDTHLPDPQAPDGNFGFCCKLTP